MSTFNERQKSLFDHLKDAEEQYSFSKSNKATTTPDHSVVDKQTYRKLKHEMKQFRGRESIFKREAANIRECLRAKTIPDYIRNPEKWVYYSLSDVTPEQMSESTNTATAVAFIRELEEREAANTEMETDTDETGAVFKRPNFLASKVVKKESKEQNEKAVFKSNKIIMPEYVVGVSKKKVKKNKIVKKESEETGPVKKMELKLNHLYDDEDE